MTIRVTAGLLRSTAADWDGWAESCDDARRDLLRISSSGFGPPAAALDGFLETWAGRAADLRDRGQRHGDALRSTAADFDASDAAAAAGVTHLLPAGGGG